MTCEHPAPVNITSLHDRIAEQAWGVLVAADLPEGAAVNVIAHAIASNVLAIFPSLQNEGPDYWMTSAELNRIAPQLVSAETKLTKIRAKHHVHQCDRTPGCGNDGVVCQYDFESWPCWTKRLIDE